MLKILEPWKINSWTLLDTPITIKIIGDKSLSKRDFKRVLIHLSKFGANFKLKNDKITFNY